MVTLVTLKSNIHLWLQSTKFLNKPLTSIIRHRRILSSMEQPHKRRQLLRSRDILNRKQVCLLTQEIQKSAILDDSYRHVVPERHFSFLHCFVGGDDWAVG